MLPIEDIDKSDQFRRLLETGKDEAFLVALVIILDEVADDVRRFGNSRSIEALVFAGGPNSGKGCRVVTDVESPHAARRRFEPRSMVNCRCGRSTATSRCKLNFESAPPKTDLLTSSAQRLSALEFSGRVRTSWRTVFADTCAWLLGKHQSQERSQSRWQTRAEHVSPSRNSLEFAVKTAKRIARQRTPVRVYELR